MRRKTSKWISILLIILLMASGVMSSWQVFAAEQNVITVDGNGEDWAGIEPMAISDNPGYEGFHLGDVHLKNDSQFLYYWAEAKNVPNWGDNGMYLNVAINVNNEDSKVEGNPWGAPFHFGGTDAKPQFHIVSRVKNDHEIAGAALYSAEDFNHPKLSTWENIKGAQFAADRTKGFEGRIPLSELGLENDDRLKAIAVLSGNTASEHGAFDVSPEAEGNNTAVSWNEKDQPNGQSVYSKEYTLNGISDAEQLELTSAAPADGDEDVKTTSPIILTFNESIKLGQTDGISLKENGGQAVTAAITADANQLKIVPETLQKAQDYTLTVPKQAITGEKSGTELKQDLSLSFKTSEMKSPVKRHVQFTYSREDADYDGWNIWTWQTGLEDGEKRFTEETDQGAVSTFEIGAEASNIGFVIRKGQDWAVKDPYDQDRYIETDPDQPLTKVFVESGKAEFHTVPAIKGPVISEGKATFFYRDQELFENNAMSDIEHVKIKIDGKQFDMKYDKKNEYFTYTFDIPEEGKYEYSYLVTKGGTTNEVTDPYYEQPYIDYVIPKVKMKASVFPKEVTSNQNAVLSLDIKSDQETIQFSDMYADASSLGGPEVLQIDPALKEVSLSVKDSVPAGDKEIPVTAVDEFGNKHTAKAAVSVKPRVSGGEGDFDWDEARIYFMLTDRFYDGDKGNNDPNHEGYDVNHPETYHGGDFKGITKKLDYLDDLGINTIWITPIVDNIDWDLRHNKSGNQYGYHGYWAKDFSKLDEHLGEMDDLNELLDKAHERNMKVMVDVVLNHTGYGLKETDKNEQNIPNFPGDEDRERFKGMLRSGGTDVIKGELAGLPDLITEDPAVRKQIIDWQTAWASHKTKKGNAIDYFRVDTVKHVEDTTWKAFKNELTKVNPNFKMIGEYYGGGIDNTGCYLNSGQMDSLLDFNFKYDARDFINGEIEAVEARLEERNGKLSNTAAMGQFLSSHDEDGFLLAHAGGDKSKQKIAAALQITAKGQPVIYYGEELGQTGKHAGDMDKGEFNENRYNLDWDNTENNDLLAHYQKLLNIRKDYSRVFSKGERTKVAGSNEDGYLVFNRDYKDQSLVIGINTTEDEQQITIDVPFEKSEKIIDLYSGKKYKVSSEKQVTVDLVERDLGGTFILALENDMTEPPADGKNLPGPSDDDEEKPDTGGGTVPGPNEPNKKDDSDRKSSGETDSKNDNSNKLPLTATNTYTYMVIGAVLLIIGTILFRKKHQKT